MVRWIPKDSDKLWLFNLVQMLKVGGTWVAPIGFTFVKKGPMTLEIVDFDHDDPNVTETIERTKAIGKMIGVYVDIGK